MIGQDFVPVGGQNDDEVKHLTNEIYDTIAQEYAKDNHNLWALLKANSAQAKETIEKIIKVVQYTNPILIKMEGLLAFYVYKVLTSILKTVIDEEKKTFDDVNNALDSIINDVKKGKQISDLRRELEQKIKKLSEIMNRVKQQQQEQQDEVGVGADENGLENTEGQEEQSGEAGEGGQQSETNAHQNQQGRQNEGQRAIQSQNSPQTANQNEGNSGSQSEEGGQGQQEGQSIQRGEFKQGSQEGQSGQRNIEGGEQQSYGQSKGQPGQSEQRGQQGESGQEGTSEQGQESSQGGQSGKEAGGQNQGGQSSSSQSTNQGEGGEQQQRGKEGQSRGRKEGQQGKEGGQQGGSQSNNQGQENSQGNEAGQNKEGQSEGKNEGQQVGQNKNKRGKNKKKKKGEEPQGPNNIPEIPIPNGPMSPPETPQEGGSEGGEEGGMGGGGLPPQSGNSGSQSGSEGGESGGQSGPEGGSSTPRGGKHGGSEGGGTESTSEGGGIEEGGSQNGGTQQEGMSPGNVGGNFGRVNNGRRGTENINIEEIEQELNSLVGDEEIVSTLDNAMTDVMLVYSHLRGAGLGGDLSIVTSGTLNPRVLELLSRANRLFALAKLLDMNYKAKGVKQEGVSMVGITAGNAPKHILRSQYALPDEIFYQRFANRALLQKSLQSQGVGDIIFIVDKSGSMSHVEDNGYTALENVSAVVLASANEARKANRKVSVIYFNNWATEPIDVTHNPLMLAMQVPDGGTELAPALQSFMNAVLLNPKYRNIRQVFILSDFEIGDEREILGKFGEEFNRFKKKHGIKVSCLNVGVLGERQKMILDKLCDEVYVFNNYDAGELFSLLRSKIK